MPEINLTAGTLPPPACYASEQDRLDAYAAAIIAQYSAPPEWSAGAVAPADLSLYWLRLDSNQNPVEVLKYNTTSGGWARVQTQFTYGVGAGVANAYTLTLTPASPGVNQAYRTGVSYVFVGSIVNTGASTLSVDGLAVKAITKFGTTPLVAGDIRAGQVCVVVYDGTRFQLLNPGNVGPSNFSPGIDRQFLRTNSTPATVWESGYITPVASYLAIPAAGASVTFTHGLTVDPLTWDIGIICITDDSAATGYIVGDYIPVGSILRSNLSESDIRITSFSNSSVIGLVRNNGALGILVNQKTTGNGVPITEANWRVMARAIR
tara:strand:- start:794 stop:1756 length:963 start_codon:yes stop_codon:yes gene_type:complete